VNYEIMLIALMLLTFMDGTFPITTYYITNGENYICFVQYIADIMIKANNVINVMLTYILQAGPLQAWSGPEVSRKLRFPDFMTTAQDGGKVVSLTHRLPLSPRNTPGTHFC